MMGGFGMGFTLIFWAGLLVLAILWIRSYLKKEKGNGDSRNFLLDILKQRYANGEVGREEYLEKKRDLV